MAKDNKPAEAYAVPHTMSGKNLKSKDFVKSPVKDPNILSAEQVTTRTGAKRVSLGDPAADDVKTTGMKQRGSGAATKGFTSRGPMG